MHIAITSPFFGACATFRIDPYSSANPPSRFWKQIYHSGIEGYKGPPDIHPICPPHAGLCRLT